MFADLKDLIGKLLSKFSWSSVLILITGIAIGFVMCAFIYLIIVLTSLKKNKDEINKNKIEIENEELKRLIRSAQNQYFEESSNLPLNQKVNDLRDISWRLINDIAKLYYPESKHPLCELTIDEFMMLNHYITNRVDSLFKGRVLRMFKKIKIAQILKLLEFKKKFEESKIVKVAKKAKVPTLYKATMAVLNVFNPSYWVKKLMVETTMSVGTNKIASTVIDIVGEETIKIYSKSVFNEEKVIESDVEKTIMELEQGLENENI